MSSSTSAAPIRSHSARMPAGELGVGQLEVALDVVADRRDDDRGDVAAPASATAASSDGEVVVVEEDRVGVVLGRRPARAVRHRPAADAVVGARARTSTLRRPVAERATSAPSVVASVPFLQNIAQSAWATWSTSDLGQLDHARARTVEDVAHRPAARATAASISGWRWPSRFGPHEHMRSRYSAPSTSQIRQPSPRAKNCGKLAGRNAAFMWPCMPPGTTFAARARSASSAARPRSVVMAVSRRVPSSPVARQRWY